MVRKHTEGIRGAMNDLIERQEKLIFVNHSIISKQYFQMKSINSFNGNRCYLKFVFNLKLNKYLCMEGYNIIKFCYEKSI